MITAIFSIKPKYVAKILDGSKDVELRRRAPRRIKEGDEILIWESSPRKRLAGIATVEYVDTLPLRQLWFFVCDSAGITREEFDAYFKGLDEGVAVYLTNVREFYPHKPDLEELRDELDFRPPQSFRYLTDNEREWLDEWMGEANAV